MGVPFDTHNDLRFAADALSGGLLVTIYAEGRRSVRGSRQFSLWRQIGKGRNCRSSHTGPVANPARLGRL
jgi:hypothetical protein